MSAFAQVSGLEEVVVTAQRREQSIMEVPIAVTLVSGQELETFNLETSHDLQFLVPGVTFAASSSTSQITLRGVGTGYSGPGLSNSVSVYTDESYVSQQVGSNQLFYDMASVQVLKGPQGTLYGRNTTGGAMLYATSDPDLDGYSGYVQAGVAELDTTELEGAVNIPLGSSVAVRFAGKYNDRGEGHVTNVLNGSEIGGEKETGFRAKLLWQPSDRLSLVFKYEQLELESNDEGSMRSQLGVGLECFYCEDGSLDGAGLGFYETNQTPIAQSEQAVLANMGYQGIAGGTLRHQMEIDIQALNVDFDVTDNLTLSSYTQVRDMERIGGQGVRRLAHKLERGAKNLLFPNVLFEKFGVRYFGPIDGHNLPLLVKTFEYLKEQEEPVILHIITEKGRGYKPALDKPGKFHGLGPYNVEDGSTSGGGNPTYSEIFGRAVTNFAKEDEKIVAVTAAMPGGTKLEIFKEELPDRYFDVGIAEEHAALFSCGLATQGLKPFLAIYSTFMQRAYDMIIHDMALQELPVRLCMDRGGLSGDDGPTHHGLFDIGYLLPVPNIVHMQPTSEDEFVDMLWTMAHYDDGPIAVRYPRGAGVGAQPKETPRLLEIGKGELVHDGQDVALIGLGFVHDLAVEARAQLEEQGYSVALVNPRFIKPLDEELILDVARRCKVICTFEDHVLKNGFGASIIALLHDHGLATPVERVGWPDEFVEHGKVDILRSKHGITAEAGVQKVLPHLPCQAASA